MTFHSVSRDELEAIAHANQATIHVGAHEADVTVAGVMYVARIGRAA